MNLTVTFAGDADWEANINTQVQGGNPPNISFFPQPGKLADFARQEFLKPLDDAAVASINENWAPDFAAFGEVDGVQYGTPAKSDLKGIVFYKPALFEADGYEVPTTFDEFTALVDEMAAADGPKPLCVGIESGTATGWMFTDWTEDMVHAPARRRRLRRVGHQRGQVRRSDDRRVDADRQGPLDRRERVRRRWHDLGDQLRRTCRRGTPRR